MKTTLLKMNLIKATLCMALGPMFVASSAMSAVISWDASPTNVNFADPTQVFTDGTFVTAVKFNSQSQSYAPNNPGSESSTATLNGVTFVNWNAPGGVDHISSFASGTNNSQFYLASPVGTYQGLLSGTIYVSNSNTSNPITFSGLTIGQSYKLQIWTPIWDNNNFSSRYSSSASNGATNATAPNESPTLNTGIESGGGTGGVISNPQFIFGTFTADQTTQNLYYFGNGTLGMIGALELRAVPEPSTIGLLSLAALALIVRYRCRRSAMLS